MNSSFSQKLLRKIPAPFVLSAVVAAFVIHADEDTKPVPPNPVYPVQRYESLWKRSFFKKTGPTTASRSTSKWNLAGIFEIDGQKSAVIVNESGAVETISTKAPNAAGIQLVTIQPGGKGAPPRVEISQNGSTEWVTSRKIQPTGPAAIPTNRALVNSRAGSPVPRPPGKEEARSNDQANAQPAQTAPPSPLDVPTQDVPLPVQNAPR